MHLSIISSSVLALAGATLISAASSDPYADPGKLPAKTDSAHGQVGYNDCQKRYGASSQSSKCQNAYINSAKDFCLWAPPKKAAIGDSEEYEISWCMASGYGTRLIPDGTIKGAHFLKTPSFVQITGVGDLTSLNIPRGDQGGELDPHGATGAGNPIGGQVYTNAYTGEWEHIQEWQNFMSYNEFCFRACRAGPHAKQYCPHIYDLMGCLWNEPANYDKNVFEDCNGNEGKYPGVYGTSTWHQGQNPTPPAHKAGKSSQCARYATISNSQATKIPTVPAGAAQKNAYRPLIETPEVDQPSLIKVIKRN
ncbi:hypothetical protein K437DRAFT_257816 [Tilletiaria anomala UBC 951]|uniref:Carbohydrate-binding module family 13 protein n=1 Tax=Tilletiaria anomala (strain ATCC 24038 / CBS 436.72 / UBC 951) TaxID=1037660 RepID=A0A066VVN3_TILAU|nr:uncharacterized protein K437DRAFT_257816 [Tilletiaria anomala UBC 951]KDN42630.1 hypothetical protein K437DRAFT_257816 [Tilletiaria anomala UBC 951]